MRVLRAAFAEFADCLIIAPNQRVIFARHAFLSLLMTHLFSRFTYSLL